MIIKSTKGYQWQVLWAHCFIALNTCSDILWIANKLAKLSTDPGLKDFWNFNACLWIFESLPRLWDQILCRYQSIIHSWNLQTTWHSRKWHHCFLKFFMIGLSSQILDKALVDIRFLSKEDYWILTLPHQCWLH